MQRLVQKTAFSCPQEGHDEQVNSEEREGKHGPTRGKGMSTNGPDRLVRKGGDALGVIQSAAGWLSSTGEGWANCRKQPNILKANRII